MRKSASKKLIKQIYTEGVCSFWYFPTISFVLFIMSTTVLCGLITTYFVEHIIRLNLSILLIVYEGSIFLMLPFLLYIFRRNIIQQRTKNYEKKLLKIIADYQLTDQIIEELQGKIAIDLKNQKEKKQLNSLLVKLSVLPIVFVLLKNYNVLSLTVLITPLIVLMIFFLLNYFTPNEWIKNLSGLTSKRIHQLTFVNIELTYIKTMLNDPFVIKTLLVNERSTIKRSTIEETQQSLRGTIIQRLGNFFDGKENEALDEKNGLLKMLKLYQKLTISIKKIAYQIFLNWKLLKIVKIA